MKLMSLVLESWITDEMLSFISVSFLRHFSLELSSILQWNLQVSFVFSAKVSCVLYKLTLVYSPCDISTKKKLYKK